jgi:hypothetical protein
MTLEDRGHGLLLVFSNDWRKDYFGILGISLPGLVSSHRLGFDAPTMTHRAASIPSRLLLLAALAAGTAVVATVHAQPAPAPTSPKAFGVGVAGAKKQITALAKQAGDKATRAQKSLADTEAARTKLAAAAPTPTQKEGLDALDAQIAKLKEQLVKLGKIQAEIANLDAQLGVIAAEPACASDEKGPKPKLATAKRTTDGVIGSSASEIAVTKTEEKAQTAPKMKQLLSAYARDVQAVATGANAVATSLTKLQDQAAKLPRRPIISAATWAAGCSR